MQIIMKIYRDIIQALNIFAFYGIKLLFYSR